MDSVLGDNLHTVSFPSKQIGLRAFMITLILVATVIALIVPKRMPKRMTEILWSVDGPSSIQSIVRSGDSLIVAGGKSYDCLDASTGRLRWRIASDGAFLARPRVGENRLYAATSEGAVTCRSLADGRELWRARVLGSVYADQLALTRSLCVASSDGAITAFNATTGVRSWSRDDLAYQDARLESSPDGLLVATGQSVVLLSEEGDGVWQRPLNGVRAIACGWNRTVCICTREKIMGLSLRAGAPEWEIAADGPMFCFALRGEFLLVGYSWPGFGLNKEMSPPPSRCWLRLDANTGNRLWSSDVELENMRTTRDGWIIADDRGGEWRILDVTSGHVATSGRGVLDARSYVAPVVEGDRAWLEQAGRVVCLRVHRD